MQSGSYDAWIGRDAYDPHGDKIGEIVAIYYDDVTSRPEWIAVLTGFFGTRVSFVPIAGSIARGGDLQVAYDKSRVKDASNCEADGHLSEDEERWLFEHYHFDWKNTGTNGYGDAARADTGYAVNATNPSDGEVRAGKSGVQRTEPGRARLRKYVVTEKEKMIVAVTREKVAAARRLQQ